MLAVGVVVGRIFHAAASPEGAPWMWTLADGHHKDRTPTHLVMLGPVGSPIALFVMAITYGRGLPYLQS